MDAESDEQLAVDRELGQRARKLVWFCFVLFCFVLFVLFCMFWFVCCSCCFCAFGLEARACFARQNRQRERENPPWIL